LSFGRFLLKPLEQIASLGLLLPQLLLRFLKGVASLLLDD